MAKLADEVFDREFLAERTPEEIDDDLVETYPAALERTVAMIDRREWSEAKACSSIAKTLRLCYKCSPQSRSSLVDALRSIQALGKMLFYSMSIQERIAAEAAGINFPALDNYTRLTNESS